MDMNSFQAVELFKNQKILLIRITKLLLAFNIFAKK